MEQDVSDIILFIGRFHPVILHLPIGFLVMASILEGISRLTKSGQFEPAIGVVLLLGCVSAAVAAFMGLLLAQSGAYNEQMLSVHQWAGISVVLTSVVAYLLKRWHERHPSDWVDRTYLSLLSAMMLALALAGHYGGSLTHGSNYLTEYMPNGLRAVVGLPPKEEKKRITDLQEAVVYHDIIYPILETSCTSCHNESKLEGGLQMQTPELLLEGGENGPIFVEGNVGDSEMFRRIHLPEHHEEHMPPDGKRQLTNDQVELLEWWVSGGAPFNKKVSEVEVDEEIQSILNTLVDPQANMSEAEKLLASTIPPADQEILTRLRRQGMIIRPISANNNWLQAKLPPEQSGDSLMADLSKLSTQITWLDMGGSPTTDEAMSSVGNFTNLTRLHLENTKVTDAGLSQLTGLTYLEYLNLYGTKATDEGIQHLKELANLKKLFVWQTLVTKEGALQLKKTLPDLDVNLGLDDTTRVMAEDTSEI